ncbi:MAG TPA: ABC transporter ATP-binding protein [Longimicrobium sp.]
MHEILEPPRARGAADARDTQGPAGARPAVLEARGLTKVYAMGAVQVLALDAVDLDLYAGELVVLLGASGSGKSTLLNILGGLDVPTSGTVRFFDHDLTAADERELTRFRREHVGFVFQFYNLIPSLTARENVALVTDIAAAPMDPADALALVGLGDRLDHFPAQLSGGEQQRVAIARAVAKRPDILLCDEPTGALDFRTGQRVLEVIEQVNRELGTTTAVITHNAVIAGMADRVLHMSSGRISHEERNAARVSPAEMAW